MSSKVKVGVTPWFPFEATIATFLDKNFEIIPLDLIPSRFESDYAQSVYGNWCAPLKFMVASYEKAVICDNVEKIIGINYNFCSFPFILGNIHKWIKADFEYYPITINKLQPSTAFVANTYKQLKKVNPKLSPTRFIRLLPGAKKRLNMAQKMQKIFYKTIPLVKKPELYRKKFDRYKNKFINALTINKSEKILSRFKNFSKRKENIEEPKHRILVSGDAEIILLGFALLDLEVFFGQRNIEIILSDMGYQKNKNTELGKKTSKIITSDFSSKNSKTVVGEQHLIESSTLYHVLKGIEKGIEGIVFIKPNMCSPCDNISFILRENNYFDYPYVEISYDEHSGMNGVVTRLEAFINILKEKKYNT